MDRASDLSPREKLQAWVDMNPTTPAEQPVLVISIGECVTMGDLRAVLAELTQKGMDDINRANFPPQPSTDPAHKSNADLWVPELVARVAKLERAFRDHYHHHDGGATGLPVRRS